MSKNNVGNNVNESMVAPVHEFYREMEGALPLYDYFTDDKLERIYAMAHSRYMQRRFTEALDFFRLLTIYRMSDIRYLKAYAACQEMCGCLQDAIQSYARILALTEDNRDVAIRHARCIQMLARKVKP